MAPTPASRLKHHELRRARRLIIVEGTLGALAGQLTQGILLVRFAQALGAQEREVAILLALPQFIAALQVFASWFISHTGDRKRVALSTLFLNRFIWLSIGLSTLFLLRPGAHGLVWALIGANAVASLASQMAVVACYSWVADLAPVSFWGRFLGRRAMIAQLFATPVGVAAGLFADWWFAHMPGGDLRGIGGMAVAGSALGFTAVYALSRVPAVTLHRPARALRFDRVLAVALADADFRRLALTRCWMTFFVQLASPMWQYYALKFLGVPLWTMKTWDAVGSSSTAAGNRLCGRLADFYGYRPVAILFCVGMGTIPIWWMLASRDHWTVAVGAAILSIPCYWIVLGSNTLGSFSWAGVNLCAANLALKLAAREHRAAYVALFQAAIGITGGCGALAGGQIVTMLKGHLHPTELALAFQMVFLLSALGRWAAMIGLASVREPGALPTLKVARALVHPHRIAPRTEALAEGAGG